MARFKQNIIRFLFSWTLTYKLIELCVDTIQYIKDYGYISDTLYSDSFKLVLKKYLNLEVSKDWIGRLYGIINPNIDINGKFDVSNIIIELDGDNTNSNEYVKTWCMKQLMLISDLFKIEKLYNYIDLDFKHVGPTNGDNYLLVFDMVSRKKVVNSLKKFLTQTILYIIIAILVFALI